MRFQTFTIDGKLPGLNDIVREARTHWSRGARQKKEWTRACAYYAMKLQRISSSCKIQFTWIEPDKRRDVDNIAAGAKFILDGMIEAGKLAGDGRQWVRQIVHVFPEPDKKNPRIVVEIVELG
jgi:Holliday junction resolvase RusA-like endonuclease